jgi:hypothetical protein
MATLTVTTSVITVEQQAKQLAATAIPRIISVIPTAHVTYTRQAIMHTQTATTIITSVITVMAQ